LTSIDNLNRGVIIVDSGIFIKPNASLVPVHAITYLFTISPTKIRLSVYRPLIIRGFVICTSIGTYIGQRLHPNLSRWQ